MPGRPAVKFKLDRDTHQALEIFVRWRLAAPQLVLRVQIILLASDGTSSTQIASELAITRKMVGLWRRR